MERFVESLCRERRLAERHAVKTPLRLRIRRSNLCEQKVESLNVSRRGVYFNSDLQLSEGAMLDVLLEMPEQITGVPDAHCICLGHVVRVEPRQAASEMRGIGVEFDFYVMSHAPTPRWELGPGLRGPVSPR